MAEYRTIVQCTTQLEVALRSCDGVIVHFLNQEGFITEEVHDEVLNPRLLNDYQKATKLVTGVRNKVFLRAQSYHTFLNYLCRRGNHYGSIVKILDEEYNRQLLTGN